MGTNSATNVIVITCFQLGLFQPWTPNLDSQLSTLIIPMPQRDARSELFSKPGSILFGTPQRKPAIAAGSITEPTPPRSASSLVNSTTPSSSLGYFAFPQGSSPAYVAFGVGLNYASSSSCQPPKATRDAGTQWSAPPTKTPLEAEYEAHQQRLKKLHEERLAREAEEARKGEEYWVSCGGVLRDEFGRRDMERTKMIREELRLREVERKLTEMWEGHERRWKGLQKRTGGGVTSKSAASSSLAGSPAIDQQENVKLLTFADIPWPVQPQTDEANPKITRPVTLQDLTREKIEQFLLEPLTVRGCKVTRKERIRSSLLRWHPDKMSAILRQTDPQEKENVMEGIHAVIRCLQRLNTGS